MKSKFPALIAVLLISALAVTIRMPEAEAQPPVEIVYDDGTSEEGIVPPIGQQLAVKFSLPLGLTEAKLLTARYYIHDKPATFRVHIYGSDGTGELILPPLATPSELGWFEVDLSGLDITVTGDFYISIEYLTATLNPSIGNDLSDPDGRSYYGTAGSWTPTISEGDYMIRAVVQQPISPAPPVGGVILPVDTLALLAPYIAMLMAVAAAAVATTKALRKRIL